MRSKWTTSRRIGQTYRDLDIWAILFQQISRSPKQFVLLYWQVGREGLYVKYLKNYCIERMHRPGGQDPTTVSVNVWRGRGRWGLWANLCICCTGLFKVCEAATFPVAPGKYLYALPTFVTVPGNSCNQQRNCIKVTFSLSAVFLPKPGLLTSVICKNQPSPKGGICCCRLLLILKAGSAEESKPYCSWCTFYRIAWYGPTLISVKINTRVGGQGKQLFVSSRE